MFSCFCIFSHYTTGTFAKTGKCNTCNRLKGHSATNCIRDFLSCPFLSSSSFFIALNDPFALERGNIKHDNGHRSSSNDSLKDKARTWEFIRNVITSCQLEVRAFNSIVEATIIPLFPRLFLNKSYSLIKFCRVSFDFYTTILLVLIVDR